jgi:hypothetical protein
MAMTREQQEQLYLDKISALIDLYKEVDSLVKSGYDGPFMGEDIRPLMQAYFKAKWGKKDEDTRIQTISPTEDAGEPTVA